MPACRLPEQGFHGFDDLGGRGQPVFPILLQIAPVGFMQKSERGCVYFRMPPFEFKIAWGMSYEVQTEMKKVEEWQQIAISEEVFDEPSHWLKTSTSQL
jgi:hypothetical protein